MKIEITAGGIYGNEGEVPVGTILTVEKEPIGWAGRYRVIGKTEGKEAVTNPAGGELKAEHHGGGKFNITKGEEVLQSGLSKADADAFNAMSEEDKDAYVAEQAKA